MVYAVYSAGLLPVTVQHQCENHWFELLTRYLQW